MNFSLLQEIEFDKNKMDEVIENSNPPGREIFDVFFQIE